MATWEMSAISYNAVYCARKEIFKMEWSLLWFLTSAKGFWLCLFFLKGRQTYQDVKTSAC